MKVTPLDIPDVLLVEPDVFTDARGYFLETYRKERYQQAGIADVFVQDNLSKSRHGVLRGLHYQYPNEQAKLVMVVAGWIYDVAVDIRRGSPTFGKWVSATLSERNRCQLYVPPGFAHGFCVMSDLAWVAYKVSAPYAPDCERCISGTDAELAIPWPVDELELSDKDRAGLLLSDMPDEHLPRYRG